MDDIPDLWGTLNLDVLSPKTVLMAQSAHFEKRSKGLLRLDIQEEKVDAASITKYHIYIVAPVLNNERHELATLYIGKTLFPVRAMGSNDQMPDQNSFMKYLHDLFNSKQTKSILDSLVAKINDENPGLTKT